MKLTPRTAGALTAAGGLLFLLTTYGLRRLNSLVLGLAGVDVPQLGFDCCGCFGIGAFAVPLGLLAFSLFREPPEG